MPMFEPKDVAPPKSYSPMPNIYYDTPRLSQVDLANGGVASMFRERPGYAEGGEIRRYESREYNPVTGNFERVIREGSNYLGSGQSDPIVSVFDKEKGFVDIDIPTIDPFSGEKVSAQDQAAFTQPQAEMFPTISYDPIGFSSGNPNQKIVTKEILDQTFGNNPYTNTDLYNRFGPEISMQLEGNFPTTNEVPKIDPFSGQQVSMQDQTAFTQPQAEIFPQQNIFQPPSPVDQFIGERRFQAEADAAARSGIPFTKTIQDYLPNIGFNVPGHMDYFNKIREAGLPQSEYNILGTADLVQRNIDQLPSVLKPAASVLAPAAAFASSIPYEGIQAYQRMQPGSGVPGFINAYLAENPFQTMMSRTTGASQPLANQIQNLLSPTVSSAQRSQQEASARVTPRMAYGGRVSMSDGGLTTTVPPDKGPDSQGVESLFRRRYS